jgi:predicted lipase
VTGHSLGGALASLAALHIYMDILDNKATPDISLFTIGEPRVGDKDFAKKIDDLVSY